MANTKDIKDIAIIAVLVGSAYFAYTKWFKKPEPMTATQKSDVIDSLVGNKSVQPKITIQGGESGSESAVDVPIKDQSVDPNYMILRSTGSDGGVVSYRVPVESLSSAEKRAIEGNRFYIDENGKMKLTILPQGSKTIKNQPVQPLGMTGPKNFAPIKTYDSVLPQQVKTVKSTLTPSKSLRTITTSTATTTYKGNAAQIAIGRAADTAKRVLSSTKSLFSSVSKKLKR